MRLKVTNKRCDIYRSMHTHTCIHTFISTPAANGNERIRPLSCLSHYQHFHFASSLIAHYKHLLSITHTHTHTKSFALRLILVTHTTRAPHNPSAYICMHINKCSAIDNAMNSYNCLNIYRLLIWCFCLLIPVFVSMYKCASMYAIVSHWFASCSNVKNTCQLHVAYLRYTTNTLAHISLYLICIHLFVVFICCRLKSEFIVALCGLWLGVCVCVCVGAWFLNLTLHVPWLMLNNIYIYILLTKILPCMFYYLVIITKLSIALQNTVTAVMLDCQLLSCCWLLIFTTTTTVRNMSRLV